MQHRPPTQQVAGDSPFPAEAAVEQAAVELFAENEAVAHRSGTFGLPAGTPRGLLLLAYLVRLVAPASWHCVVDAVGAGKPWQLFLRETVATAISLRLWAGEPSTDRASDWLMAARPLVGVASIESGPPPLWDKRDVPTAPRENAAWFRVMAAVGPAAPAEFSRFLSAKAVELHRAESRAGRDPRTMVGVLRTAWELQSLQLPTRNTSLSAAVLSLADDAEAIAVRMHPHESARLIGELGHSGFRTHCRERWIELIRPYDVALQTGGLGSGHTVVSDRDIRWRTLSTALAVQQEADAMDRCIAIRRVLRGRSIYVHVDVDNEALTVRLANPRDDGRRLRIVEAHGLGDVQPSLPALGAVAEWLTELASEVGSQEAGETATQVRPRPAGSPGGNA